ncbi:MAG: response regulator transcription factor [Chitinophagaceae bacterium]|nr:response regulator transcription factor [Chitinophagaceae bacterium]
MYHVAIVDDHVLIARALSGILNTHPDIQVLYEVENGKQLQEKLKTARNIPDVILLDISMPVMDGYETASWLKQEHPEIRVLTLSMQNDDQSLIRMVKQGAKGYLLKNVEPDELVLAIRQVMEKGFYFPEWAASRVFMNLGNDALADPLHTFKFSDRELEFLQYCCTEMTYKEMAAQMFCSPRTVEGYRDALFDKLNLSTRVGLAMFAVKQGIVKL